MTTQTALPSPVELGRYLLQLREQADIRQAELAKRVSLSPAVLSRIETGDRPVTLEEVIDILNAIPTPPARNLAEALGRRWTVLPMPPLDHGDQTKLWNAEQVAVQLDKLLNQPDVPQAFARRVGESVEELKRCAGLLLKREHQVAFIGPIGVGKSKAICHMTGLTVRKEDGILAPVLTEGAGGTTLCEVHLLNGPEFGISIEPCTSDEIREDVRDFAEHVLKGTGLADDESGRQDATQGTYKELARAIRNMADLAVKSTKDATGKRNDPAKALAEQFSSVRELSVEILARMNLHTRDRRQLWYDPASGKSPHSWLRDEFRRINNGSNLDFTIPKRIDVIVKESLVAVENLSIRIIDTKGVHATAAREDLEIHLKDPHTLAVICSGFNGAPGGEAQQLLGRALDSGIRDLEVKSSVLVLARHEEALAVTDDATGAPVDTVEEGYELKRDHALMNMHNLGLKDFRIGFYNCLRDPASDAQQFISDGLQRARQSFSSQLAAAVKGAQDLLENQLEQANQAALDDAAERIRVWVKENSSAPRIPGTLQEELLGEIMVAHASAVHAAARREGEWRNFSYSYQLGFGARKLAVGAFGKRVDGFSEYCRILRATPGLEVAGELVAQTERVLLAGFDQLQTKCQLAAQTTYREALKVAVELWQPCVDEWGRNRGYRQTIAAYSREWLNADERIQIEGNLRTMLEREWARVVESVRALVGPAGS